MKTTKTLLLFLVLLFLAGCAKRKSGGPIAGTWTLHHTVIITIDNGQSTTEDSILRLQNPGTCSFTALADGHFTYDAISDTFTSGLAFTSGANWQLSARGGT